MKAISHQSTHRRKARPALPARCRHQGPFPPLVSYARHKGQFVLTRGTWVGALPASSGPLVIVSDHYPRPALARDLLDLAAVVVAGTREGPGDPASLEESQPQDAA